MGAFARAAKVKLAEIQEQHLQDADAFSPGPRHSIPKGEEEISDAQIRAVEALSREQGYRIDRPHESAPPQTPVSISPESLAPGQGPSDRSATPEKSAKRTRRLRRRLINVPQESKTMFVRTSALDAFDVWCDEEVFTKKDGFIEMVERITSRSRQAPEIDEGTEEEGRGPVRGQLPRRLARRLGKEPEEPVTFYVPTRTIELFEQWCEEKWLTHKDGFAEMVRRVTRKR